MARTWDFSCPDWRERIRRRQSLMPDLPLFEGEAADAVEIFDNLCLPDVPGKPLLRDAAGEWFREIVAAVLGSRDPETNIRHVPELLAMVPKGNSKTTYSAGLMLTALLMNVRPNAAFFLIAPSQATAEIAYDAVAGMIKADPELSNRFWVRDQHKRIEDRENDAQLEVKTFSLEILNGPKPVGVLLDEIHLIAKDSNAKKVLRQIRGGLQKNSEGFLVITTTQSNEPPQGVFESELKVARNIRDGKIKGRLLPILYEFPEDIAKDQGLWSKPDNWSMVMPNLGRSLRIESLIEDWEAESGKGSEDIRLWASQHLNIQIGVGLAAESWAGAEFWEQAAEPAMTFDDILARCDVITVGVDGGGLDDLLGLAVCGREKGTGRWLIWCHAWAHPIVLHRRKEIAAKLSDLEIDGDLTMVPRPGDDVLAVADIIDRIEACGLLAEKNAIGVDSVGIGDIFDELTSDERGIDPSRIVGISQGWKLSGAIKTTERKVAGRDLLHCDQKLMAWCVGNAKSELRGNATTVNKQISGSAKIDPLMALFNAVYLMALSPDAKKKSVYEERGLLV